MEGIGNLYLFLASVVLISMSGVLMPGPLFAVTIDKASKRRSAGVFIALGHGIVELPLMILIYFGLMQFGLPEIVQIIIGLFGGLLMILMGIRMLKKRDKGAQKAQSTKQDSFVAGIWTTAANAGFILWWTTVGTTLLLNAQTFGLIGFSAFAATHWFCDFLWYSFVALLIFKSQRFWTRRVHQTIFLFCFVVFVGYGSWFLGSALFSLLIKFFLG
jgi:threonine/homoserine/homoserine lactone efflux protein